MMFITEVLTSQILSIFLNAPKGRFIFVKHELFIFQHVVVTSYIYEKNYFIYIVNLST